MVDTFVMAQLVKAIESGKLILVGDAAQLASVAWSRLQRHSSFSSIPHVELKDVHRVEKSKADLNENPQLIQKGNTELDLAASQSIPNLEEKFENQTAFLIP